MFKKEKVWELVLCVKPFLCSLEERESVFVFCCSDKKKKKVKKNLPAPTGKGKRTCVCVCVLTYLCVRSGLSCLMPYFSQS